MGRIEESTLVMAADRERVERRATKGSMNVVRIMIEIGIGTGIEAEGETVDKNEILSMCAGWQETEKTAAILEGTDAEVLGRGMVGFQTDIDTLGKL
jgi:hypothetical protein